jgi:hypothetical protein
MLAKVPVCGARGGTNMWRSLLAAVVVYTYGHPGFDGFRPGALDRPLQSFHREVNFMARDGQRVLATLDDARSIRYLQGYMDSMDAQLRGTGTN